MNDFDDWFQDAVMYALVTHGEKVADLVQRYPFMYEDYFEQGLSASQAVVAEWG